MKTYCKRSGYFTLVICSVFLPSLICSNSFAQVANPTPVTRNTDTKKSKNPLTSLISANNIGGLFSTSGRFIKNIGQYGDTLASYGKMGKIHYGYEGLGMPVLFTSKGLIHLQRRTKRITYEEMERNEKKGLKEKDKSTSVDQVITMEWLNANTNPQIITENVCPGYYSYGLLKEKAQGYKKIIYKELYPGVDLVYSFTENKKAGFEYSLIVRPGADVSKIKMKYGADVKSITQYKNGTLIIRSGIEEISITNAVCYYTENADKKFTAAFLVNKNVISFILPENYTPEKTLVIDPFVSATGNLSGSDAAKAKDIDYDYAGNIYVAGGGDPAAQKLAKYDANGVLQWTFNGSLNIPVWNFGGSHGGWVVEKGSGNIYLGQGLESAGFRVIRLNTNGLYDDYITTADPAFVENWKMLWNCDGALPKIFVAGGGGNSNKELASIFPPALTLSPTNLTGINTGHNDISDIVIDPISNDMYTIFSTSVLMPSSDNKIYKHKAPYTAADVQWSKPTGYYALSEPVNRPYVSGLDNSSNTLAINSGYLFYWDGKNLKAFNKSNGSVAGTPLSIASNVKLMQGGIIADECNNVFVGSTNGTIKVYRFNGNVFDDNAAADISIAGYPANSVYDMVFDQGKGLLYACGNGFVSSIDLSAYCASPVYSVSVINDCSSVSVSASISPAPPAGSIVTYNLFDGTTQIGSNTTGLFNGLTAGTNYEVVALVNQACGGIRANTHFTASVPPVLKINNPAAKCSDSTVDITLASVTEGSSTGLTFTYWLDAAATITYPTPSVAKPGTYYIKGMTTTGCSLVAPVVVTINPGPIANAGADAVICFGNKLQLKGSGGTGYSWSPSTFLDNPKISNPTITNPGSGSITYYLKVTDAFGCESLTDDEVKITFAPPAKVFAGHDTVIAINQPLQLNTTDISNSGFTEFLWSPAYGLNNPFIANPVAVLDKDISYTLHASNPDHCTDDAVIKIKVFKAPEIFVPNSFTPNGDGLNDILKAIPVGMKEFHYFNLYNRYGRLVFSTTEQTNGWDGKVQGKLQDGGVFVWITEAIDYKGNIIQQKGTTMLVR